MDADEKMPFNPIFQSAEFTSHKVQQVTHCTCAMIGPVAESGNTPEIIPPGQLQGPDDEKHLMQKALTR